MWPVSGPTSATTVTRQMTYAAEKIELLHEEVLVRRVGRRFFLKPLRFFLHTLFYLEDFCRFVVTLQKTHVRLSFVSPACFLSQNYLTIFTHRTI